MPIALINQATKVIPAIMALPRRGSNQRKGRTPGPDWQFRARDARGDIASTQGKGQTGALSVKIQKQPEGEFTLSKNISRLY
jgi:hypothetical protein